MQAALIAKTRLHQPIGNFRGIMYLVQMKEKDALFNEFEALSKADWLQKVEQDLKGKALNSLSWQLNDRIAIAPLTHREDQLEAPSPILEGRTQNAWHIGEEVNLAGLDEQAANQIVLKALAGGADTLQLVFPATQQLSIIQFDQLFKEVHLNMISCHFLFAHPLEEVETFFTDLANYLTAIDQSPTELSGSFGWIASYYAHLEASSITKLLSKTVTQLPGLVIRLDGTEYCWGTAEVVAELAQCLKSCHEIIASSHPYTVRKLHLGICIGTDYLVEIAKIRALKLLWANVIKAYDNLASPALMIEAQFTPSSLGEDVHSNMIQAATYALSAVIGGAHTLYVTPADSIEGQQPSDFTRRIARNVQHLLKQESYMDRVIDPAAGSYYIEGLTKKLADEAWKVFAKL